MITVMWHDKKLAILYINDATDDLYQIEITGFVVQVY